jgi:predicted ATPase/DNA-binding CsgD family transcriptional regulator
MRDERAGNAGGSGTVTPLHAVAGGRQRAGLGGPHNLPASLTPLIGREQESAEIARLLATTRLLTLTGAPGVGKTRLALEVGDALGDAFPDGVWLVELAPLADPDLVPQAIATVLRVREQPSRSAPDTLADVLRGRRVLLLLDNCEHLIDACADLANGLLRTCPYLVILATSREPLGIDGETTWHVPSLALPEVDTLDAGRAGGAPTLAECASVRLFVERARAARPQFSLTGVHASAVARICRRLDGIPLALELAAARVTALSVDQIASRLDDRFHLLTGGSRTALPRQQTLRATVDWSYDLLSETERALLRRLAVFAGGWSLEAAEAIVGYGSSVSDGSWVMGDGGTDTSTSSPNTQNLAPHTFAHESPNTLDVLQHLVDRSLVVAELHADGADRYRMLETLQQYALERLAERGETDGARLQHAIYFLGLAERAEGELRGPREGEWSARLEDESENLRAALRWVIDRGEAALALRLGSALWRFWTQRGHLIEGLVWLEQALALTTASGTTTEEMLRYRAGALNGAGNVAAARGEHARAALFHDASLALRRRLADPAGEAISLHNLGTAARNLGDPARAYTHFSESLDLFRTLGDTRNAALSLLNLGRLSHDAGDYERATSLYSEGLALFRTVGSDHGVATALNRLGDLARDRGELAIAERLHGDALSLRRGRGDPWVIGLSLTGLARAAAARHDHAQTMALAVQSVQSLHDAGASRDAAAALVIVATAATATGQATIGTRLLGAVSHAYPEGSAIGAEQASFEQAVAAARAALGEDAFAEAWASGQQLTLDQAVDVALALAETPAQTTDEVPGQVVGPTTGTSAGQAAGDSPGPAVGVLTRREREVAALVARGLTNRQIADEIVVSEWTVDSHVRHILTKLNFRSRAQVARWAVEQGLRSSDADE